MKKRLLSIALLAVIFIGLFPARSSAAAIIHSVGITNLDAPKNGVSLDMDVSLVGTGYSVHSVEWYNKTSGYFLSSGEVASTGQQYEVIIWLMADSGYEFNQVNDYTPNVTATVNGIIADVNKAYEYNAWAMIEVCLTFPATPAYTWVDVIDLSPTAPSIGKDLTYDLYSRNNFKLVTLPGTESYTKYGESWMCNGEYLGTTGNKFSGGNTYTYCATVTPAYGYSFGMTPTVTVCGNPANYTVNNVSDIGEVMYVSYTFPKLEAPHEHSSSEWVGGSTDYHYKVCSSCGESFQYEDHVGGTATCFEQAKCTLCGTAYGGLAEHTSSAWRSVEPYHYKVCTVCGDMLTSEDHVGGTATCSERAKCTVCGTSYGQLGTSHRWGTSWVYKEKEGHASVCLDCGAAAGIVAHTPGPAATETSPQVCTDCGYIITPVKKHVHQLTKISATNSTCSSPGNKEYYICSGCSDLFSDAMGKNVIGKNDIIIPPSGHVASSVESNGEFHWKTCTQCQIVLSETKLPHVDADKNGKCDSCDSVIQTQTTAQTDETSSTTVPTELTEPTRATTENTLPMTTVLPETSEVTTAVPETTSSPTGIESAGTVMTDAPSTSEADSATEASTTEKADVTAILSDKDGTQGNNEKDPASSSDSKRLEKRLLIALAIAIPSFILVAAAAAAVVLIIVLKKKKK